MSNATRQGAFDERCRAPRISAQGNEEWCPGGTTGAGRSPFLLLAQLFDVRHVMRSVPGIKRHQFVDVHRTTLGMIELASPIGGLQRLEQDHPALMHIVEERKGSLDGSAA